MLKEGRQSERLILSLTGQAFLSKGKGLIDIGPLMKNSTYVPARITTALRFERCVVRITRGDSS